LGAGTQLPDVEDYFRTYQTVYRRSVAWLSAAAEWPPRWYRIARALTGYVGTYAALMALLALYTVWDFSFELILGAAVSAALLLLGVRTIANRAVSESPLENVPARLSDEQLAFYCAMAAHEELRQYEIGRFPGQLEAADQYVALLEGRMEVKALLPVRRVWSGDGYREKLYAAAVDQLVPAVGSQFSTMATLVMIAQRARWTPCRRAISATWLH
jgi:hypothetical protein